MKKRLYCPCLAAASIAFACDRAEPAQPSAAPAESAIEPAATPAASVDVTGTIPFPRGSAPPRRLPVPVNVGHDGPPEH